MIRLDAKKDDPVTQAEYRLMATVLGIMVSVSMGVGSWWLTNQHQQLENVQRDLKGYAERVEDNYVKRDYFELVMDRLNRIEEKVDDIRGVKEGFLKRDRVPLATP
jgi:hypothetical protein